MIFNLRKGLENEFQALESCKKLIEMVENEEDKVVIQKIKNDEVKHIRMVEQLIKITEEHYSSEK